jgi:signal transduction histidine kinase/ActR/RegA family two-component response regulator/HAMP domain-containing protein
MKGPFRSRPIRDKVNALIAVASGVALLLAGLGVLAYDLTTLRPRALRDLTAQAELIRINTTAALAFQDPQAAAENLATLRAKREIDAAALYTRDNRLFASYLRDGTDGLPFTGAPRSAGHKFENDRLILAEPVADEGQQLGWLTLQYQLTPLWSRLPQYGIIAGVVLLALLTVAILLSRLLESSIIGPLGRLAEASRTVARVKDRKVRAVKHADDEIGHLTDAFNEMLTTLEAREAALQESTSRLLEALTVARMTSWAWDVEADTISWGGQEGRVFGAAGKPRDPTFKSFLEVIHPADKTNVEESLLRAARSGERCDLDFRVLDPGGRTRWLTLRGQAADGVGGSNVRVVGLVMDVTDRRQLEEQLLQSQKLEAIGRLAGGVAHDFNNLLTGILGYATFALKTMAANHPARNDIIEIERAAVRAAALTGQLLSYARRQMVAPKLVRLNDLIDNIENLLQRLLGEDISLETRYAEDLWPARIDPSQFEQVIINLSVNGRDAMPRGGRLTIETRNCTLDDSYTYQHPEVAPGEYVMLAVADSGHGMDPVTQARIFEPFFTTKEQGKGTGLGLAVCYGIVKQAGGHVWVYSEPGRGTTFKVFLPRSIEEEEPATVLEGSDTPSIAGTETVLVVEDESVVRSLAVRALVDQGYRVLQAPDGQEALITSRAYEGEVHLLVTDVVMPGMNGKELADRLATERPGLRVLYVSGYTDHAVVRHGVLEEGIAFLSKPFDLRDLVRTVREVLDSGRVRSGVATGGTGS